MAGVREITAGEFINGSHKQSLFFQRSPLRGRSPMLWGTLHSSSRGSANRRNASLRCRAQEKPGAVVSGACGLTEVTRLERSRRYLLFSKGALQDHQINEFAAMVHDRMTECVYTQQLTSFETSVVPDEVRHIPVMERGRKALEEINQEMGLAFDEQDLQYYTRLFKEEIKRNPTTVELFDIAQSNSEHSRHWFFTGKIFIDGQPMDRTLMQIVKSTLQANPNNSVIGFKDNSSAIRGFLVKQLRPVQPGSTSPLHMATRDLDILFTAETHNFPCAVAPYPGAETGAGGRIRDTHATGRGSFVVASTAGYCVGNLNMEGSYAPWEDSSFSYPSNLASPLQILIDASNGASDYGNKFVQELGKLITTHISKGEPDIGHAGCKDWRPLLIVLVWVVGLHQAWLAAKMMLSLILMRTSVGMQRWHKNCIVLFVACIEMGEGNPIISIHDQGAGGNCNVVKEIIYPKGGQIDIRAIVVGDYTCLSWRYGVQNIRSKMPSWLSLKAVTFCNRYVKEKGFLWLLLGQ
ncbi:hypothetical protein M0R45_024793 [Rubus argutus]|uniref:Phosphoribosylformylglycinamidine synthase n=1 Tax=Rubus argutus TaxID=59490 RepID=A0AAW1WW27_RUBAR